MSANQIWIIFSLITFSFIYAPISLYQIWRLYSCTYRKQKIIESLRKRYTSLSLICSLAYTVQFIDLSVWLLAYSKWFNNGVQELIFVSSLIHLIMLFTLAFCIILRFWLCYFKIIYEMTQANDHWKKIINPNYQIQKKLRKVSFGAKRGISNIEWILANRHKWGNLTFCLKTGGVAFVVLLLCIICAQIIHGFYRNLFGVDFLGPLSSMITYSIFALMWSGLLWIYCRMPSFYDHIFVKQELSYLFHFQVLFFFVLVVFAVLFGFQDPEDIESDKYFSEIIGLFHLIAFGNLVVIHIFTYFPLTKLKQFEMSGMAKQHSVSTVFKKFNSVDQKNQNGDIKLNMLSQQLKLEDVLKNEYGFGALMKHLAHEFSSEVLLSVTEFTMFKKYLFDNVTNIVGFEQRNKTMYLIEEEPEDEETNNKHKKNNMPKESDVDDDAPYVVLPFESLPKSEIIYNDEYSNKEKAYLLYVKYIQTGAEYEINIAGPMRSRYRTMLENKRKWITQIAPTMDIGKIATMFDEPIDIMLGLMGHSFVRFKRSESWEKVVIAITTKQSIDFNPNDNHL